MFKLIYLSKTDQQTPILKLETFTHSSLFFVLYFDLLFSYFVHFVNSFEIAIYTQGTKILPVCSKKAWN